MELFKKIKVKNDFGLHIRPAASIAKILNKSASEVILSYKKKTANAKSIMNMLMLGVKKNAVIGVLVKGKDANFVLIEIEKQLQGIKK